MLTHTRSGREFDITKIASADIDIFDIAEGLSNTCRYSGQHGFFSVAQHSLFVERRVAEMSEAPRLRLAALLHDASEAYMADLPSYIKAHCPNYVGIERRVLSTIFERFGLDDALCAHFFIKTADREARWTELTEPRLSPAEAKLKFLERFHQLAEFLR